MNHEAKKGKPRSLSGTNLYRDARTGIYIWRRVDERSGKRFKRSTGTRLIKVALSKAQQFEEDYERENAGLSKFEGYRRELGPFIEPFLASLSCQEQHRQVLHMQLQRAFDMLGLKVLADIENFIELERRLLCLEGEEDGKYSRRTLARCFQSVLKQFSRFLAERREIPTDHLAAWRNLRVELPSRERKALSPDLMVRSLYASDCLDRICLRKYPLRPVWTSLLIAAPRVSALAALEIPGLDREKGRLLLRGCGNKRVGAGALDDITLSELIAYVGTRTEGPLFLSSQGQRMNHQRSIDCWRTAVSMAAVDIEWPAEQPRELRLVYLVSLALMTGRIRVAMGGQSNGDRSPGVAKRAKRNEIAELVAKIADQVRERWEKQMRGVDQHCLRMTHRTWALVAGVPEILIDRQLGHSSPAGEAALKAAWSAVGRQYYTDMGFLTGDAKRSAQAVRQILDRATSELQEIANRGGTALKAPEKMGRLGIASA